MPPNTANSGSKCIVKWLKNAIKTTALKLAPPVIPIISGEAIGFFNTFCNIKPLIPSAAPAKIASVMRGKRNTSKVN
ncbi:Uncharacterised protein [Staphylococcus aureus]|nr:Uncharacterised protein [Staphylococcus aureus]CPM84553.1 Uncharacterised protein [Staphylococcus aureus]